jgi:cytoskeletal protein CcmA (bactofilin family)
VFRRSLFSLLIVAIVVAIPAPAWAETVESDYVLIRPGDVIGEDLYALGNRAEIAGRVEGDLVVAAAGEVIISGTVTGDVLVLAGSVSVLGEVGGSVRALTPRFVIDGGNLGEDVLLAAWQATVNGEIGRDLLLWARSARVEGSVGGDVDGQQRELTLAGKVEGDVDVSVRKLSVEESAVLAGDLRYVSRGEASVSPQAEVDGQQVARKPLPANVRIRGLGLLVAVLAGFTAAAAGLALLWAVPGPVTQAASRLRRRPVASLVTGLMLVATLPALAAIAGVLFTTASPEAVLPLLAVFIPLLAAVSGLLLVSLLIAPAPAAIAAGELGNRARSFHARLLVGLAILGLMAALPWIGLPVLGLAVAAGLGSWVVGEHEAPRPPDPVS